MTIQVCVIRGFGDLQGPDVIDPLLSTENVAVERGRVELDKNSGLQEIQLTTVFRDVDPLSTKEVRMGQIILVIDALQGEEWRGKISGIRHSATGGVITTDLTVQKPALSFTV